MEERAAGQPRILVPAGTDPSGVRAAVTRRLAEIRGLDDAAEPLVRRLVGSFLERSPARLERLAEAIGRCDATATAEAAHSLAGSAANLGAELLAAQCTEVDEYARAGRLDLAADRLPAARAAYAEVEPVLRGLLAAWGPGAGG